MCGPARRPRDYYLSWKTSPYDPVTFRSAILPSLYFVPAQPFPFQVFLQFTPTETPTEPIPETTLNWVPLHALYPERIGLNTFTQPLWSTVTVDTASRLAPRHSRVLRPLMRLLVGSMQFPALVLSDAALESVGSLDDKRLRRSLQAESGALNPALHPASASICSRVDNAEHQALKLWGLSLGMTLDLLSHMSPTPGAPLTPWDSDKLMGVEDVIEEDKDEKGNKSGVRGRINAPPSLTSVFPRFSYPDVNFWIWYVCHCTNLSLEFDCRDYPGCLENVTVKSSVIGKRLSESVVQMIHGTLPCFHVLVNCSHFPVTYRVNWTGAALTTFYAAVRKALVVVLVLRAIGVLCGVTFTVWWMLRQ